MQFRFVLRKFCILFVLVLDRISLFWREVTILFHFLCKQIGNSSLLLFPGVKQ